MNYNDKEKWLLPDVWKDIFINTVETKMGYHVVSVKTKNKKLFKNVLVENQSYIKGIYDYKEIPFSVSEIENIYVTHIEKPPDFDSSKWLILEFDK